MRIELIFNSIMADENTGEVFPDTIKEWRLLVPFGSRVKVEKLLAPLATGYVTGQVLRDQLPSDCEVLDSYIIPRKRNPMKTFRVVILSEANKLIKFKVQALNKFQLTHFEQKLWRYTHCDDIESDLKKMANEVDATTTTTETLSEDIQLYYHIYRTSMGIRSVSVEAIPTPAVGEFWEKVPDEYCSRCFIVLRTQGTYYGLSTKKGRIYAPYLYLTENEARELLGDCII